MTTIRDNQFVRSMEGFRVRAEAPVEGVDVAAADLNGDGVVEGDSEMRRLFLEVDKLDRDGSRRSMNLEGTPSGAAYRQLMQAREPTGQTPAELMREQGVSPEVPRRPATTPTPGQDYRIPPGATMSRIARDAYGDANAWRDIQSHPRNAGKIGERGEIAAGASIFIPERSAPGVAAPAAPPPAPTAPPPAAAANDEGRLRSDAYAQIETGQVILRPGARGEAVRGIKQALQDSGVDVPDLDTDVYTAGTAEAVRRYQRERGLQVDGSVGPQTLRSLRETAPPEGSHVVARPEYDRLFADGRLDTTFAVGFDEDGWHERAAHEIQAELRRDGYQPLDVDSLGAEDRQRYGLDGDRFDPESTYFAKTFQDPATGQDIDSVVRLITPSDTARARFEQALETDEVVQYVGHARYGTGPDFDDRGNGDGNFVINRNSARAPADLRQSLRGQPDGLAQVSGGPDYQLLVMNGCTTEDYIDDLRSDRFAGRDRDNTDIVMSRRPLYWNALGKGTVAFLDALTRRESVPGLLREHNEFQQRVRPEEGNYLVVDGFLDNAANTVEQR